LRQKGISELICDSVKSLPDELQAVVLRDVVLTGGSSLFPGLFDRFVSEVTQNFDSDIKIGFRHEKSPNFYLDSMSRASISNDFQNQVITKKTYEEYGSYALVRALNF
jgi:actin-related protein